MDDLRRMIKAKIPGESTGIEIRKSICTICDASTQCGLDCYVKDGRVIKVEGSRENPHSRGKLCAKGAAQRQWVYHEDRLLTPLKRVGPRGSGELVPISWAEALDTISDNLQRLKAKYGPESVVFYCGYPKHVRPFLQRLAYQFGSPNFCTESSTCFKAVAMAWQLVFGQLAGPDLGGAECLLIWSADPFHTNAPVTGHLLRARERGLKLIVVDPRLSPTAAAADIHLPLRPGTDGALALAMANVIISEGLHDREFVSRWTRGFEEYRAYVAEFTPERAAEITRVPPDLIREAARLYATTKPAALMWSASPVVHHTNGVQNHRAVISLVALTGNYDVPGGNVVQPPSWLELTGAGFVSRQHDFEKPRSLQEMPPRLGAERFPVWGELVDQAQSMDLPRQLDTDQPYPLRGLVAFGMNHRMWPDPKGLLKALDKLEFFCDVDLFATDTARYADIALPTSSSLEHSQLRCYPQKYAILTQPVIEPLGEARSDTDIIFGLAARLGLDDPLLNPTKLQGPGCGFLPNGAPDFTRAFEAALDWILEPTQLRVGELKKHPGGMPVPDPLPTEYKKYEKKGFPTPSGKVEFVSSVLEKYAGKLGVSPLPAYEEPRQSPVSTPDLVKRYPFILNTGSRLPMFIHSRTFRLPWTRSLRREAAADINPTDARRLGIEQGDLIKITTTEGSIEVKANVTEVASPGVVHMYHGYPEADVNTLIPADYLDPISGFPGFKSLLCAVEKSSLRKSSLDETPSTKRPQQSQIEEAES